MQQPAPQPPAPLPEAPLLDKGRARAQAAYLMYRNMGTTRSIRKLALVWEAESGKSYSARRGALERWSTLYNWTRDAMAWDGERADEERRVKDDARKLMDEQQAQLAKLATTRTQQRINALMGMDEREQVDYEQELQVWEVAITAWSAAVAAGTATNEQLLNPPKKPRAPRLRFTAHALVQYFEKTTQLERMAREAATAVVAVQGEAQLPPVVEVRLAGSPPSEPVDPLEGQGGQLPPAVAAAARAAMPGALVGLPTQPPSYGDEGYDDDEDEDE